MKKLLETYKNLPPELRMMIAFLGIGTPIGVVYALSQMLHVPTYIVILGAMAAIVLLTSGGWLVSKGVKAREKRRTRRMSREMSDLAERGQVSMDAREAIKENNTKFARAVDEMRKVGVNVYDLPWYIVIGDSGCGKTFLVSNSGLTFSGGKPEGYRQGTLNYNWWFTEEAIFIDMAGRLCNPQDDADRREWTGFLETISRGRKGYPINGAIVCVSSEHLLQDSPEKQEQDANTALERLRDLQDQLGVTFATHLVVTKSDRILGFMQFFDLADRDITVKNQMFGWSRPGDATDAYEPEGFEQDFDELYGRLNELRVRRLSDDEDALELGTAYSFPEEFRELRAPLNTYVRTLFPHTRLGRNLILRGVYFTSATQTGSVILKQIADRTRIDTPDEYPPLDTLYPTPRPHFIKELLLRKAVPEYGLVFRNEKTANRSMRLARVVRIGSLAAVVLVLAAVGVGFWQFGKIIGDARNLVRHDESIRAPVVRDIADVAETQKHYARLATCRQNLQDRGFWPTILSLGIGTDKPVEYLEAITAGLFEKGVFTRAVAKVEELLKTKDLGNYRAEGEKPAADFSSSLESYLFLCGRRSDAPTAKIANEQELAQKLKSLAAIDTTTMVDVTRPVTEAGKPAWDELCHQFDLYAAACTKFNRDDSGAPAFHPPRYVAAPDENIKVVQAGVARLRDYLRPLATIAPDHPDPVVAEWARIDDAGARAMRAYTTILGSANASAGQDAAADIMAKFAENFRAQLAEFKAGLTDCRWNSAAGMTTLAAAVERNQNRWRDHGSRWMAALGVKPDDTAAPSSPQLGRLSQCVQAFLRGRSGAEAAGLDDVLTASLQEHNLLNASPPPATHPSDSPAVAVLEVFQKSKHIISADSAGAPQRIALHKDAETVQHELETVASALKDQAGGATSGKLLADYAERIEAIADALKHSTSAAATQADIALAFPNEWMKDQLLQLRGAQIQMMHRLTLVQTVRSATEALGNAARDDGWGIGELTVFAPEGQPPKPFDAMLNSFYEIRLAGASPALPAPAQTQQPSAETPAGGRRRFNPDKATPAPRTPAPAVQIAGARRIPVAATSLLLTQAFMDASYLADSLQKAAEVLTDRDASACRDCRAALESGKSAYLRTYFTTWRAAYEQAVQDVSPRLQLRNILDAGNWQNLNACLQSDRQDVENQLVQGVTELLENVVWADHYLAAEALVEDRSLVAAALGQYWKSHAFVDKVRGLARADQTNPWKHVAEACGRGWRDFVTSVRNYPSLPRRVTEVRGNTWEGLIWNVDRGDQSVQALEGMGLVDAVQRAASHAKALMDVELHECAVELQRERFSEARRVPFDAGMPVSLVNAEPFAALVNEMSEFFESTSRLEKSLAGAAHHDARVAYAGACGAWRNLIFGQDKAPWKKPLQVTSLRLVRGRNTDERRKWWDLMSQDFVQVQCTNGANYYGDIELAIGLQVVQQVGIPQPAGQDVGFRLAPSEARPEKLPCQWNWPAGGEPPFVRLKGTPLVGAGGADRKFPEMTAKVRDAAHQLLLPWLLLRCGEPGASRSVWIVPLCWDTSRLVTQDWPANEQRVKIGTVLEFQLGEEIPEPFELLKKP